MTYFKKEKEIKKYADKLLSKIDPDTGIDIYSSQNILKSKFGTDIHEVVDFLEKEGYIIIESSDVLVLDESTFSELKNSRIIRITEKGTQKRRDGGILKEEGEEIKEKRIKSSKDIIGIIGGIVAICGGILGMFSFFSNKGDHNGTKREIDSLKNEINIISERQLELDGEYIKHIDTLYSKIKKLEK